MSETPRTDAVVNKLQREQVPFIDAYVEMRNLARELERSSAKAPSRASRKKPGRRANSSTSKKKVPRKRKS